MNLPDELVDDISSALRYAVQAGEEQEQEVGSEPGYYTDEDMEMAQAFTQKLRETREAFERLRESVVRDALGKLDGSTEKAVELITGSSPEELSALGGIDSDG